MDLIEIVTKREWDIFQSDGIFYVRLKARRVMLSRKVTYDPCDRFEGMNNHVVRSGSWVSR